MLEARTAEAKAAGLKDDAAFEEAQKVSDALRGHEALLRDLAARGDPGLAEALEKAAADGFTEDEAVTLAQASKGLLDALASGDVATVDAALGDAACLGDCPAMANAKQKRDQLESDLAATKLQGARRSSLAKERVKQLTQHESDRVAAIAELKRASAAACASLGAPSGGPRSRAFPRCSARRRTPSRCSTASSPRSPLPRRRRLASRRGRRRVRREFSSEVSLWLEGQKWLAWTDAASMYRH